MTISSEPVRHDVSIFCVELAADRVPKGRLLGQNIDLAFDGWMQLLAAVEEALAIAVHVGQGSGA